MTPIPDYDTPWKDILDQFFEPFMAFFFPAAHRRIDWARGFEFLDKELQKITNNAAIGRRAVDKLVKVWLKRGGAVWVLIHVEVQGQRERDFGQRVFVYHYRSRDRFNTRVASFVMLTDADGRWRPDEFSAELLGTTVSLRFVTAKLLDYRERWEELEQSRNPFAMVVMAYLRMMETRRDARKRFDWKLTLTGMLYERGYSQRDIIALYRFLDWVMILPEDLQIQFDEEAKKYKEGNKMPYLSSIERRAIERGMQQGMQQGMQEGRAGLALRQLQRRFGALDDALSARVRALSLEQVGRLGEDLLDFTAPNDLHAWLEKNAEVRN